MIQTLGSKSRYLKNRVDPVLVVRDDGLGSRACAEVEGPSVSPCTVVGGEKKLRRMGSRGVK